MSADIKMLGRKMDHLVGREPGTVSAAKPSSRPALPEGFEFPLQDRAELERLNTVLDEVARNNMVIIHLKSE